MPVYLAGCWNLRCREWAEAAKGAEGARRLVRGVGDDVSAVSAEGGAGFGDERPAEGDEPAHEEQR